MSKKGEILMEWKQPQGVRREIRTEFFKMGKKAVPRVGLIIGILLFII